MILPVIRTIQPGGVRPSRTRVASELRKKVAQVNWEATGPRLLLLTCALITAGMLGAGLWPFHSPKNQVRWDASGKGLHFGGHGTILSSGRFKVEDAPAFTAV